jgi:hypothetical protein
MAGAKVAPDCMSTATTTISSPPAVEVIEPDPVPIMTLHRHSEGYISFATARDKGEDFRPLISIRADEMARYFPQFRAQLPKDSFVSINASYQLRKPGKDGAAYGTPLHRTNRLRYLCAAYADVDYYKLGKNYGEVLGKVVEMQRAGAMPKASIIVESGRGMWFLYLLHDPKDPTRAQGAFPDKLEMYFRLQRAIGERLATLGSDPCARDAARYLRVPGSLHTGSEQYARWWIQGEGPRTYSYSLAELCRLFDVSPPMRHHREVVAINPTRSEAKRRGWVALNARRLREFDLIREFRGGFSEGARNIAALFYAWFLRCNGVKCDEAAAYVRKLGSECHPPLSPRECVGAIKTAYSWNRVKDQKPIWMRDQTIADGLAVTPEEVATLDLRLPPAGGRQGPPDPAPAEVRAKSIQERRAEIARIIAELGKIPTARDMGRRLIEAGFRGNHRTVLMDYAALGVESSRTRAARSEIERKYTELQPLLLDSGD